MTAIRNFPNAPLRQRTATRWRWQTPRWLVRAWHAMERYGQERAARQLELLARYRIYSDPQMAQQLRNAATECRRGALMGQNETTRSAS
jgi:hypothetical protein